MKQLALSLALAANVIAGDVNIVQLGPPDAVGLEIACEGIKQNVELPHGGTTGLFALPVKPAVISATSGENIPSLKIPATADTNIAVLSPGAKGYRWSLIPGKPTEEKWTLRAINLAAEPARLTVKGEPVEIKPDATLDLPANGIYVRFDGGEKFSYDGSEPCAVIALIHRKDGAWQVLFVPDR